MKVTVIGGAGAFGERLSIMLARDGHQVTIAGRDLGRARRVADRIGGLALRLDREGDLAGLVGSDQSRAVPDGVVPVETWLAGMGPDRAGPNGTDAGQTGLSGTAPKLTGVAGTRLAMVAPTATIPDETGATGTSRTPAGLTKADVVIDAAGPFRTDGPDPWRVAKACIAAGIHYLDLSDNAAFTRGISALDDDARAAGVAVISGLSSVPALSSAVVTALSADMDRVLMIDTAILPGNRNAPRGRAVMESILANVGTMFPVIEGGLTVQVRGWSRPQMYKLGQIRRRGWMIEVPDQSLFPSHFGADTVTFRAGMEVPVMNHGLAALGWLRARTGFRLPRFGVNALHWLAQKLAPFGTDTGGMVVTVTGQKGSVFLTRTWTLIARDGDGPFIPGIVARTLLRDETLLTPGARPALAVFPLASAAAAMADLAVTTIQSETVAIPMFVSALGAAFGALPHPLQAAHLIAAPITLTGLARVTRGTGRLANLIATLARFPPGADDTHVTVIMQPEGRGELWVRDFGGNRFQSHLRPCAGSLTERFGPLTFQISVHVQDGALHYPVTRGWCLGIPLPRCLLPVSEATETVQNDRFTFDVRLSLPLGLGLMVHYQGWLEPLVTGAVRED